MKSFIWSGGMNIRRTIHQTYFNLHPEEGSLGGSGKVLHLLLQMSNWIFAPPPFWIFLPIYALKWQPIQGKSFALANPIFIQVPFQIFHWLWIHIVRSPQPSKLTIHLLPCLVPTPSLIIWKRPLLPISTLKCSSRFIKEKPLSNRFAFDKW